MSSVRLSTVPRPLGHRDPMFEPYACASRRFRAFLNLNEPLLKPRSGFEDCRDTGVVLRHHESPVRDAKMQRL